MRAAYAAERAAARPARHRLVAVYQRLERRAWSCPARWIRGSGPAPLSLLPAYLMPERVDVKAGQTCRYNVPATRTPHLNQLLAQGGTTLAVAQPAELGSGLQDLTPGGTPTGGPARAEQRRERGRGPEGVSKPEVDLPS